MLTRARRVDRHPRLPHRAQPRERPKRHPPRRVPRTRGVDDAQPCALGEIVAITAGQVQRARDAAHERLIELQQLGLRHPVAALGPLDQPPLPRRVGPGGCLVSLALTIEDRRRGLRRFARSLGRALVLGARAQPAGTRAPDRDAGASRRTPGDRPDRSARHRRAARRAGPRRARGRAAGAGRLDPDRGHRPPRPRAAPAVRLTDRQPRSIHVASRRRAAITAGWAAGEPRPTWSGTPPAPVCTRSARAACALPRRPRPATPLPTSRVSDLLAEQTLRDAAARSSDATPAEIALERSPPTPHTCCAPTAGSHASARVRPNAKRRPTPPCSPCNAILTRPTKQIGHWLAVRCAGRANCSRRNPTCRRSSARPSSPPAKPPSPPPAIEASSAR